MKSMLLFCLMLFSNYVSGQQDANTYSSEVANRYFEFSLKLVKETPGFSPPVASRAFGYMGLALYEGVVTGMPAYVSMSGRLYQMPAITLPDPDAEYHWPTVANNALAIITDSLFSNATPSNKDSLHTIRDNYNAEFAYQLSPDVFNDSKSFGEAIAHDIFNFSKTDGGYNCQATNFPMDFDPPVGPDKWVPVGMQVCLQPYWGSHRPFIEDDTIEAILGPFPEFSSEPGSDFYNYAYEVYETGITLTDEERIIAEFWADNPGTVTPPGHSLSMLENILSVYNHNLEEATLAYAKLGIALSDAFLACWKTKYIYCLIRPVSYIQTYIDTGWQSVVSTPPFPEYPSGHSSQSGAMAIVMTDLFGPNFEFVDSTHGDNFGGPRTFNSFHEAADEAAVSRLYGGIHYVFSNDGGLDLGYIVGENVIELFQELNVSVQEQPKELATLVFPNPAHEIISLQSKRDLNGVPYEIADMSGRTVTTGTLSGENPSVNIRSLGSGMYLFREKDQGTAVKFVKE